MTRPIIVIAITVIAMGIFFRTLYILFSLLKKGKPANRVFPVMPAIEDLLVMVLGQKKVLSWPYAGILHTMIFWGFIVLFTTIVEMYGEAFHENFVFPIIGGTAWLAFLQELFCVLVLVGIAMALILRLIVRPRRYRGADTADAMLILGLIAGVVITLLFMHAERVLNPALSHYTRSFFVSGLIAGALSPAAVHTAATVCYWLHLAIILFFLNWIPRGKHLHLLTIIPNILLRKRGVPRGKLQKLDLEDETAESFGSNSWKDFSWKDLLDTYACMECGRCVAECPANFTGKELDPKKLHTLIRYSTQKNACSILAGKAEFPPLAGNIFSEDFFWQCTTCGACVEQCPATNEHIDKIIDVRRYMVLTEGKMRPETVQTVKSMETQYNPFSMAHADRFTWLENLGVPSIEENPDAEYIYWIGCFGCFDERNKKVTTSLLKILKKAGISFAVLKKQEKCTGDPARRLGREDLYQDLALQNIETLKEYRKKIITQCPHCYNTIKNEYPELAKCEFQVIHYAELICHLIREKRLPLPAEVRKRIAYHDSCYLGRHNDIYDEPRQALKAVKGLQFTEMERNHQRSFCCGGGGAGMFMEEHQGKRINVERVEEASRKKPDAIVSNCPYCLSMFEDGVKTAGLAEKMKCKDLAEIILEAMESETQA